MKEGQPQKQSAPSFPAENFPALRSFLRGYFHQDMKDEYGSPEEAVREFCQDADSDQREALAKEWSRFLDQVRGQPLGDINRILTGPLGSSYSLTSENVQRMSAILLPFSKKPKK